MHDHFSLVPHAVCWRGDPALIWTMVVTNTITFVSYAGICSTLLFLASCTRRVIARDWAFFLVGFALFIVACGSTHLLEVVTTWVPIFWVDAWTNVITALLSGYVAVQFFRRVNTIGYGVNDYGARLARSEEEKTQMEASLLAAKKLEDWSRVSASVSHEIANPLETIQNLLYLIRHVEGVPDQVVEYARTAAVEAERTATIAHSALDLMRESSTPRPVDLREAAESVQHLLDRLLRDHGVSMRIATRAGSLSHENAFVVEAYPGEARQVLLNLIRNAVEASPGEGCEVCVDVVSRPEAVEVMVADQGVGIDPLILPKLFQFGSSTKGEQGNGMGLWTVRHILNRHGGSVRVASEPNAGTTFTLVWPRKYARTPLPKTTEREAALQLVTVS